MCLHHPDSDLYYIRTCYWQNLPIYYLTINAEFEQHLSVTKQLNGATAFFFYHNGSPSKTVLNIIATCFQSFILASLLGQVQVVFVEAFEINIHAW